MDATHPGWVPMRRMGTRKLIFCDKVDATL